MSSYGKQIRDKAVDTLEKCSSTKTRAGNLVERVGKMDAANVPHKTIATLMTERSRIGKTWTESDVQVLCDAYLESRSRPLVTAEQATALMNECQNDGWDEGITPMPS